MASIVWCGVVHSRAPSHTLETADVPGDGPESSRIYSRGTTSNFRGCWAHRLARWTKPRSGAGKLINAVIDWCPVSDWGSTPTCQVWRRLTIALTRTWDLPAVALSLDWWRFRSLVIVVLWCCCSSFVPVWTRRVETFGELLVFKTGGFTLHVLNCTTIWQIGSNFWALCWSWVVARCWLVT